MDKDKKYYDDLRRLINETLMELQQSPQEYKLPYYRNSVGSILNAYREGDISFHDACDLLAIKEGVIADNND